LICIEYHSRAADLADKAAIPSPDSSPFERGVGNAHFKRLNRRHFSIEVRRAALQVLFLKTNGHLKVCEVSSLLTEG
jgi:hypothetical protein